MTATAVANNTNVIECCGNPACRCVAVIAIVAAGHMRRRLTGCRRAIVTGSAGTDDLCMIDCRWWDPCNYAMAVFADIRGLDMSCSFAGRIGSVVTANAIARDIDMIEVRRNPTCG